MRYVTRAGKPLFIETPLWNDAEPQKLSLNVPDHERSDTGLLDQHGERIYRLPRPVGFGRDSEW